MEYLVPAIIAIVANVLDSVTTEIALNHLPEALKATEENPIARNKSGKVSWWFNIWKLLVFPGFIALAWKYHDIFTIWWLAIMLSMVVISNSEVIIVRLITRKHYYALWHYALQWFKIPHWLEYWVLVAILLSCSWLIVTYVIMG